MFEYAVLLIEQLEQLTYDEIRRAYRQIASKGPETHLHFPPWVPETMLQGRPTVYASRVREILLIALVST